jgi:hypothetical protein
MAAAAARDIYRNPNQHARMITLNENPNQSTSILRNSMMPLPAPFIPQVQYRAITTT